MASPVLRLFQHFTSVILCLLHAGVQFNTAFYTHTKGICGRQKFIDMVRSKRKVALLPWRAIVLLDMIFFSLRQLGIFLGETVQHFGKCFLGIVYSPGEHQSS